MPRLYIITKMTQAACTLAQLFTVLGLLARPVMLQLSTLTFLTHNVEKATVTEKEQQ